MISPASRKGLSGFVSGYSFDAGIAVPSSAAREAVSLSGGPLKKTAMLAVEEFGLDEYFEVIITADDCTGHKPDPEPINITLEKMGERPENAVMVGDTLLDRHCAKNAGAGSVLVSWAPSIDVHELEGEDVPDFILEEPGDLFEFV